MPLPPDSHRLQPDHLPTPFSADQIRDACQVGRLIRIRMEVPSAPPTYREVRYRSADATPATQPFIVPTRNWPARWGRTAPLTARRDAG